MLTVQFRVLAPFVAIDSMGNKQLFVTVPKETTIETSDDLHWPGLVHIKVGERDLLAFTRDLSDRATILESSSESLGS